MIQMSAAAINLPHQNYQSRLHAASQFGEQNLNLAMQNIANRFQNLKNAVANQSMRHN